MSKYRKILRITRIYGLRLYFYIFRNIHRITRTLFYTKKSKMYTGMLNSYLLNQEFQEFAQASEEWYTDETRNEICMSSRAEISSLGPCLTHNKIIRFSSYGSWLVIIVNIMARLVEKIYRPDLVRYNECVSFFSRASRSGIMNKLGPKTSPARVKHCKMLNFYSY